MAEVTETLGVPPICVSIEITERDRVLVFDHFNCGELETAYDALRKAGMTLGRLIRGREGRDG